MTDEREQHEPAGGPDHAAIGLADETGFADSLIATTSVEAPEPGFGAGAVQESPPERPWMGRHLGHFKLLSLLGEGAMGLVIRALDVHLGRMVALKVLRKHIRGMDESQRVAQFLREARAAARIDHPCVATVYEINEHKGWWFIASELIEGGSLHALVKKAGALPTARACSLAADAAGALASAHRIGIVHRDVKPQNLMLTRGGRCKVVDFGLVRLDDPDDPFDFTTRVVGSPHFVAPEVAQRKPATGASDVYGLACSLYYALTASTPFSADTAKGIWRAHVIAPRPDVRMACPECSDRIAELLRLAMSVEPAERPTAEQFEAQLRVETIGESALDSSTGLAPDGLGSSALSPGMRADDLAPRRPGDRAPRYPRGRSVAIATLVIAFATLAVGIWTPARQWVRSHFQAVAPPGEATSAPSRMAMERRFPEAPEHYGAAAAAPPQDSWSWRGRVSPGANRFVARRDGRVAYPVEAALAADIPAASAVFYADEASARAAGLEVAAGASG